MNLDNWTLDNLRESSETLRFRFKQGIGDKTDLALLNILEREIRSRHGWK